MRRGEAEMSGYAHEWAAAKQLGVQLLTHVQPDKVHGKDKVTAIAFTSGDNAVVIDCELVVWAVGQTKKYPLAEEFPGLVVAGGRIAVDAEMRTGCADVWACGDASNGGKEVVNAAAEAKRVARAIDRS
jgi:glutamate synthase (NADPH/NADH) small chain